MSHDDEHVSVLAFLSGLVCGAAIGASVALLLAPDAGRKTRKRLHRAAGDLRDSAADRWEEVADDVRNRVEEVLDGARSRLQ